MIAPDDTTFAYLEGREHAPKGADWERAVERLALAGERRGAPSTTRMSSSTSPSSCRRSPGARTPAWSSRSRERVPDPASFDDPDDRIAAERALAYMDLRAGQRIEDIRVDRVFIGSCTNSRIEDLRAAAAIVAGHKVDRARDGAGRARLGQVRRQAEDEGLDRVFLDAGFEWREAGCSMCLGMNPDILAPGERCASTSNRNFEGRQGRGGRTHLVSPQMAAAAAIAGQVRRRPHARPRAR